MSQAQDLLNNLAMAANMDEASIAPINDIVLIDANERKISIPRTEIIFGVETDKDVERKYFRCPRIVGDNIDLSKLKLRINYETVKGKGEPYVINDVSVDGDYITFTWLLDDNVLKVKGPVRFAIQAYSEENGTLRHRWNTTIASGTVLETLRVDEVYDDDNNDDPEPTPTTDGYLVRVVDIDGTVLKEERLSEGSVFTLPNAPTRDRLTFDGWSSPVDIVNNEIVVVPTDLYIGAMYTPTSGNTEFHIELNAASGLSVNLEDYFTFVGLTEIDWGDGTIDSNTSHTYVNPGEYIVQLTGVTDFTRVKKPSPVYTMRNYFIKKIYLSSNITKLQQNALYYMHSMEILVIPRTCTQIDDSGIYETGLKTLIIPDGVTYIADTGIASNYSLETVVLPNSIIELDGSMFSDNDLLRNVTLPLNVDIPAHGFAYMNGFKTTSLLLNHNVGEYAFNYNYNMTYRVVIGNGAVIDSNAFSSCLIKELVITDPNVMLNTDALSNLYTLERFIAKKGLYEIKDIYLQDSFNTLKEIDFSEATMIPVIHEYTFSSKLNPLCVIKVPAALYDEWIVAEHWTNVANYIIAV